MAVTEAEVKRLLADATGKRLHATRLASLDRLRTHLLHEATKSAAALAALDGLLAIAVDALQPPDVRMRAAEVLALTFDLGALQDRFSTWAPAWTERFRLLGRDPTLPEPARDLALRTVEARVMEEELADAATDLFIEVLSCPTDPVALRHFSLLALAEIHRSAPSFFADERRIGGLATLPLPSWEAWVLLSPQQRELAAALADPAALAAAIVPEEHAVLEAVLLHVERDPSSARLLAEKLRPLIAGADGLVIEPVHARLLRTAVDFDRALGDLSLDWVAPAIADAAAEAGRRALALMADVAFEEHLHLWSDLFRDGGRGLADLLFERLRAARAIDDDVSATWVALHGLGGERATEGDRRGLELVKKTRDVRGVDTLVALVVPEVVIDLQEAALLTSVDVPTEDERAHLYQEEAVLLPRRVRLAHLVEVLARADDPSRVAVAFDLLPAVVRWLPDEVMRFEPLLRALFDPATTKRVRNAPRLAFDTLVRILEELTGVAKERRRTALAYITGVSAEVARQASIHGLSGAAFARALTSLGVDVPAARALWRALLAARELSVDKRLDAWAALDALAWKEKDDEIGELLEELLTRTDDPEIGALLVEPFRRRWPVRFATVATRLHIAVPPVERIASEAREAIASAVSAEEAITLIEKGEPLPELLGALTIARAVVARRPDLLDRARAALSKRVDDHRVYEALIGGARTTLSVSAIAFSEQLALGDDPSAAASTLARVLAGLEDPSDDDLQHATDLARRFANSATSPMLAAAVTELERDLAKRLERDTTHDEALEAITGAYCEAIALLGDARGLRDRLQRTLRDPGAKAGARYAAFAVLSAAKGIDAGALLDDAIARFFDRAEDAAFRALLGGVVTLSRPQAFAAIVDMNLQPWTVHRPEDTSLPANSLPANMPMSWLVATLASAAHLGPLRRAAAEIATRLAPAKPHGWPKVRTFWLGLVKGREADVRRGLRLAAAVDAGAAALLALFGETEDFDLLARGASLAWTEATLADNVFWRPAGKAPAFGRYSFLEPWLEVAFGTPARYRILSDAYVHAAERAEGGDAARYAFEACLLDPDSQRATQAMTRFGG